MKKFEVVKIKKIKKFENELFDLETKEEFDELQIYVAG